MHPAFSTATSSAAFSFSCRLNHRLLYPSSSYERRATPVHPRPSLRASPRRAAPKKARLAKGRPASWRSLADQYPPPRTRTDGHACARCGPLSFSFFPLFRFGTALPPFSARLRRSPHPSLLSVCPFPRLSTTFPFSSSPQPLPLPFPSSPSAPLRSSFPTLRLRPSFSRPARPLSLVISSSFARSRFFSRFFHRPLRFFLSLMPTVLVPFAYHHRLLSFLTPSSLRAVPSSSLPSLSHIPRRLRRDGPIFSSRFLGSDIFYTFFSPSHPFDGYPCAALPRHRNIASSIRFISLSVVSHIRTWSLSLSSRLSSALFLLSFVHLSLPSHLSFIFPCLSPPPLSLSLSPFAPPALLLRLPPLRLLSF